jgi:hypothetical protein
MAAASPRGALARHCLHGAGARIDQSVATAAIGRQTQRLFVSPDDGTLARLHRMCDIRFAALSPAALKSPRARTFSFYFSLSFALL